MEKKKKKKQLCSAISKFIRGENITARGPNNNSQVTTSPHCNNSNKQQRVVITKNSHSKSLHSPVGGRSQTMDTMDSTRRKSIKSPQPQRGVYSPKIPKSSMLRAVQSNQANHGVATSRIPNCPAMYPPPPQYLYPQYQIPMTLNNSLFGVRPQLPASTYLPPSHATNFPLYLTNPTLH